MQFYLHTFFFFLNYYWIEDWDFHRLRVLVSLLIDEKLMLQIELDLGLGWFHNTVKLEINSIQCFHKPIHKPKPRNMLIPINIFLQAIHAKLHL